MWFDPVWDFLEREIFRLPSTAGERGGLFNPYRDFLPGLDVPEAGAVRRENLWRFLSSLPESPAVLLVGEAPGWRGCRFSGVPFTSEAQLISGELPFQGSPTSLDPTLKTEVSARSFWEVCKPYHPGFFVWNSLPLHPHIAGQPCSNRPPARLEIRRVLHLLAAIHSILKPARTLAIGRRAEWALTQIGLEPRLIRHPAHGGASAFRNGIQQALGGL